ncbi:YceI family protein [Thalassotalea euphylliae]|uniref:YceI family protein n=1 Tax=Thalassotalea euphylliae TaxID=1655234 RepID=A0A3E0U4W5_9GAMM|nr:YceI family protein [Thalassotalea euphylliae]REL31593.1 YceI family protein [Thalassotalea euphylliae]
MRRLLILTVLVHCLSLLFSLPVFAGWQLNSSESQLNFVTTKNSEVAEVHSFENLTGDINKQGQVSFKVSLASVDTAIPIRDERMQKYLFKLDTFASADFTGEVDIRFIEALPAGQVKYLPLSGNIHLHGNKQAVTMKVQLIKLTKNRFVVNTVKPLIINANQYNLVAGVEKLRTIAGLSNISNAVPVTFNLLFEYQTK